MERITASFEKLEEAQAELKQVKAEHTERLEAAEEGFRAIIESGVDHDAPQAAYIQKLHRVEQAWVHLQDEKAIAIENKRDAKGTVKLARQALRRAINEARQPSLPGLG